MLKARDLISGYGKTMILQGINIDITSREIVSIIGRNGVGKSTLMKTLIGVIPVHKGNIEFNNSDISKQKAYERAGIGIGYVPQGHGIFPLLTVEENLAIGELINGNKGTTNRHFEVVYELFPRLKERRKQHAGTMSGGEQAMLSIGRVLIGRPSLILLDEPSEGVQPNIVEQIGETILRVNSELGVTILIVEQHIGLVQHVSQRGYVMDKGIVTHSLTKEKINDNNLIQKLISV